MELGKMSEATDLLEERKQEINFFFLRLKQLEKDGMGLSRTESGRLLKILNSNYMLMIYNLEEACISCAFSRLYEVIASNNKPYSAYAEAIQKKWISEKTENFNKNQSRESVIKTVYELISQVENSNSIKLQAKALGLGGNLDARKVRDLLQEHGIRYHIKISSEAARYVKEKRQSLSHGISSFSDCSRDVTLSDLKKYSDEVIDLVSSVVSIIDNFIENKSYYFAA